MFFKTIVRLVKGVWGVPLAVVALVFTAIVILVTLVGGSVCSFVVPPDKNPFRVMLWVYVWAIRQVILRAAGIRVFVDQATSSLVAGERAVMASVHGSLVGMMVQGWATEAFGFGPALWVIKKESMRWYSIGPALAVIGLAIDIDRKNPFLAVKKLQAELGKGLGAASVQLLLEGTRPTREGIKKSQQYYINHGYPGLAQKLRYTCRPRYVGFQQALKNMPHERVIRLMVTSSIHEEGFTGFIDLLFTGAVFVRIEEWREPLDVNNTELFIEQVNAVWTGYVQDWIAEKRDMWNKRSFWQRWLWNAS